MGMTAAAREARRSYKRAYRLKNRDRINQQTRKWKAENRDRVKRCDEKYWDNRAAKQRASWEDYGIDKERLAFLKQAARSDGYADKVMSAALLADRAAAGHIIASVTRKLSYEKIEFDSRLGRCPLGRTNFYAARRLFFHHLDRMLGERGQSCEGCDGTGIGLPGEETV